ncbi:cytochrome P450 [Podospora australis]|uniref:Cytochrome P450 n=1 Tax=Podospora australis TaxID=1536484 RepID=A0AAN6WPK3_9PEZI|nr:cytochrome P450 [Podospora australis]
MPYENIILGTAGIAVLAYGIDFLYSYFDDPREPRRITPKIPVPVVGHVLGLLYYGFNYYNILTQNSDPSEEIYSLGVLGFKIYITKTTRLTQLVAKSKTLSFTPFLKVPADAVSSEAFGLFDGALLDKFSTGTKEALAPGPHLDAQNLRMGRQLLIHANEMLASNEAVGLFAWAKHAIVQATAVGLYGAEHPFKNREVEDALWVWEENRPNQMLGIDPLHKARNARDQVFAAFGEYFGRGLPEDVSYLVTKRQELLRQGGISEEDCYKMQATLSNAAYPNTVPTLFWTVYGIYSRPELLKEIRQELWDKVVEKKGDEFILDVAVLQTECLLLLSTYQEVQRTRHSQVAWRMVTEDTTLDRWTLKKGNYLQMPVRPVHESQAVYGPAAGEFDPYRFVPKEEKGRVAPSSFLAWGSAPHLCPARQFASTEILIAAALLILRADLTPVGRDGVWPHAPEVKSGTPTLPRPKRDIQLRVTPREEGRARWSVVIGRSKARISLASG